MDRIFWYVSRSIYDESLIRTRFNLYFDNDPCYRLKSIKNEIEIKNTKNTLTRWIGYD